MTTLTMNFALQKAKCDRPGNVRRLNVCGAQLDDIAVLREFRNVEVVSLSVNDIVDLSSLTNCPCLQELYLRRNNVAELPQLLHLSDLLELKKVSLVDNPITADPGYRTYVIAAIPSLEELDGVEVSKGERASAEAAYPGLYQQTPPAPGSGATAAVAPATPRRTMSQPGSAQGSPLQQPTRTRSGPLAAQPQSGSGSEGEVEASAAARGPSYGNDDVPVGGGRRVVSRPASTVIQKPPTPRLPVSNASFGRTVESGTFDETPKKVPSSARRVDPTSPQFDAAPSVPEQAVLQAIGVLLRDLSPQGLAQVRKQVEALQR